MSEISTSLEKALEEEEALGAWSDEEAEYDEDDGNDGDDGDEDDGGEARVPAEVDELTSVTPALDDHLLLDQIHRTSPPRKRRRKHGRSVAEPTSPCISPLIHPAEAGPRIIRPGGTPPNPNTSDGKRARRATRRAKLRKAEPVEKQQPKINARTSTVEVADFDAVDTPHARSAYVGVGKDTAPLSPIDQATQALFNELIKRGYRVADSTDG